MSEAVHASSPGPSVALAVEHLCVRRGPRPIIADLSLALHYGEVLAVLGPNGVGKSTLLRAVAGLLPADGVVDVAGESLGRLSAQERALRLSFVPQRPALDAPLPVREVVSHGRYAHRRRFGGQAMLDEEAVTRALSQADVTHLAERPFTALSNGEQQRVMVARGLCTGARILCLDEPTAALDVGHALSLYELLRKLAREGYAIMVVLHQLADALRLADRALLLSPDVPPRLGPVSEVVACGPVRQVYGVELRPNGAPAFNLIDHTAGEHDGPSPTKGGRF